MVSDDELKAFHLGMSLEDYRDRVEVLMGQVEKLLVSESSKIE